MSNVREPHIDEQETSSVLRSRCDGDHKNALLLVGRKLAGISGGLMRSPWTKVLKEGERKCLARPPRLWPPYSFFLAPPQPFWRMPITRPTIMVYPPNSRRRGCPTVVPAPSMIPRSHSLPRGRLRSPHHISPSHRGPRSVVA